jgi:hypothetical protein
MTAIYILLKVTLLLSIIVIAIRGPRLPKPAKLKGKSNFFIAEDGQIQHRKHGYTNHHPERLH